MQRRGLNKKGQEVVSNFGIVGIVGIIFLVVVVLGIWYVSTRGTEATGQIPANAEIIAQACSAVATEATINSYCLQLREIKSGRYATCDQMSGENIPVTDSDGTTVNINLMNSKCSDYYTSLYQKVQKECASGQFKGKLNTVVNGKLCSEYIGNLKCTGTNVSCASVTDLTKCESQGCQLTNSSAIVK